MNPTTIGIIIGAVAFAVFIISLLIGGLRLVRQAEVYIIERLGRYHKTLESGLNLIIPVFDKSRKIAWRYPITDARGRTIYLTKETASIDLRETVLDFPRQNVITKDNVGIEIDALLYFQVTDPKKAVYEINNLPDAIERLTQTTLRNVLGEMELDESLSSREVINNKLRIILDEATDKWGVKVNRVELKDISPPQDVKEAMEKQMKAERNRRAQILEAEGSKRSTILKAEGEQEAQIKRAEGEKKAAILKAEGIAKSRRMIAEAEGDAIMKIVKTTGEPLTMDKYLVAIRYLIANNYLQSLKDISKGKQTKTVFLPYEASGVLSSLGTMKELFKEQNV
jgi:regulator of protease activity HflC (stomatin/prohibitin superfamily)